MDGEQKMTVGLVVEIAVNLVQQLLFIGFLYLFFDKGDNRVKNIAAFTATVLILFTMENYFTFNEMTFNHLDSIVIVVVMLIYSLAFLKGKLYLRIIMPLIDFGLNMIIAYTAIYLMSWITGKTLEESLAFSTSFRYLYLCVVYITYAFLLWLILRIRKKNITLSNWYDIFAFIVIPVLCMLAMYADVILYQIVNFDSRILLLIIINLFVLVVVSVLVWFLLIRISNDNQVKTDLLLSRQREELYRESAISTGEQISQISEIKHDMRNNLKSIYRLIENNQYAEAKRLCIDCTESIEKVYTPINTDNPTLNAILNVEIEKALKNGISFFYTVTDSLRFVSSTDVVSIIGNLCDNAIEYLLGVDQSRRKMSLEITVRNDYRIIMCRNTILSSVLSVNPDMKTTKKDAALHGKGLSILRGIADKYNGTIGYKEDDNNIEVTLVIKENK
ncbi:MAG: GHKL domain-containing protein [Ruminococcus sp.]|nr:GHKL domain-containing protein [Ruminococcus sp.]